VQYVIGCQASVFVAPRTSQKRSIRRAVGTEEFKEVGFRLGDVGRRQINAACDISCLGQDTSCRLPLTGAGRPRLAHINDRP